MKMILICTKWVRREGVREISRTQVSVKKTGRWLETERGLSFDRNGKQTKASSLGSAYRYRLVPITGNSGESHDS